MSCNSTTKATSASKLLAEWFWTDRWIGSSAFLLPIGPRGLYREMLTAAWRHGARLPSNHEAIRRAIGCTVQEWNRYWPRIQGYWRVDGESLVNDTQLEVYEEARAAQQRASERGARGAHGRWGQQAPTHAQASAQALPEQSVSTAQAQPKEWPPSPSPISPDKNHPERGRARGAGNRTGVGAGSFPGDHLDHLACGPVCFTPRMTAKFIGRFALDRERLIAWSKRVCERETIAVEAGQQPAYGDDFAYWTAQYDADFGQYKDAPAGASRTVPGADETATYLAEMRAARV